MSSVRPRGRPTGGEDAGPSDELVLRTALAAFAERGYDATSVREVARELGVSHNLIPPRFGSKERLWYAAVDHGFGELLNDLLPVAFEDHADELSRLRAWMVHVVAANVARPALLRVINRESAVPGPRFDHLFERFIEPVREAGDTLLAGLAAQGRVTVTAADLVYFFLMMGAGGPVLAPTLADRFGTAIDPTDEAAVRGHAEAAVGLLFEGLEARPGPRSVPV